MNPSHPLTARRITSIQAALVDGPLNKHELARAAHVSESCLQKYLRMIHSDIAAQSDRLIHIVKWDRYGVYGVHIPVYAWGVGRDAKKPAPKTGAQKNAAYFQKRQKDRERQEFHLARRRARDRANKAKKAPQNWASALLGAAVREVRHA